jgi:hypothetical protein
VLDGNENVTAGIDVPVVGEESVGTYAAGKPSGFPVGLGVAHTEDEDG